MSVKRPQFDAPPLIEAVFDCFVEPGDATELSAVEGPFFALFPDYKPETRQEWHQFSSRVDFRDGKPFASPIDTRLAGVRRWNADGNRGVLVGPGVLALNIKPPYGHFEDHVPHLRDLVHAFITVVAPKRIQWLGHRYINQLELELEEGIDPGALLSLYPQLSKGRALTHPPLTVQLESGRFDGGSVVTTLALAAKTPQKVIYSLDIYARTSADIELAASSVAGWHAVAHAAIMDAFLESITPEARRRFKEKSP